MYKEHEYEAHGGMKMPSCDGMNTCNFKLYEL